MQAPPPPLAIVYQEMSPPAPDHIEELRRNQATTPVDMHPTGGSLSASADEPGPEVTSLVTKSLSALKSRKEQIIGKSALLNKDLDDHDPFDSQSFDYFNDFDNSDDSDQSKKFNDYRLKIF